MPVRLARLLVLVLVLVLAVCAPSHAKQNKVKVAVYYEALCPDSKRFITEQLFPAWKQFRGSILVKLVPYGKATHSKVGGQWVFSCQHGPRECDGNKIQGCVLKSKDLGKDEDQKKFEIINCLMSQPDPDLALDHCKEALALDARAVGTVKSCAEGPRGSALLASFGDKTDQVRKPLSFVPTVVFNESYDAVLQDEALRDLPAVLRRLIGAANAT